MDGVEEDWRKSTSYKVRSFMLYRTREGLTEEISTDFIIEIEVLVIEMRIVVAGERFI
jgi:hypothetical protein